MTLSGEQIERLRENLRGTWYDDDEQKSLQLTDALCDLAISAHEQRAAGVAEGLAMAADYVDSMCDGCGGGGYVLEQRCCGRGSINGCCGEPVADQTQCDDLFHGVASNIRSLTPASGTVRDGERELADWNALFLAVTMGGLPEQMRQLANVKPLWPNDWHQDCAATAFSIHGLRQDAERLNWLEEMYEHCPHAEVTYSDDPDEDKPLGYSLHIGGCQPLDAVGSTLRELIDNAQIAAIREQQT